jgi:hypothetical protein
MAPYLAFCQEMDALVSPALDKVPFPGFFWIFYGANGANLVQNN